MQENPNPRLEPVADKVERLGKEFATAYRLWCDAGNQVDQATVALDELKRKRQGYRDKWEKAQKDIQEATRP